MYIYIYIFIYLVSIKFLEEIKLIFIISLLIINNSFSFKISSN